MRLRKCPDRAAVSAGIDRLRQPAPGYQPAVLLKRRADAVCADEPCGLQCRSDGKRVHGGGRWYLTEENFAVSTDASRIAWQDGRIFTVRPSCMSWRIWRTGKKDEISFPDQTVIRLIGFVGTDLVYGLAHPNEQLTMDGRVTGLPLYAVEIVGSNMEWRWRPAMRSQVSAWWMCGFRTAGFICHGCAR